MSVDKNKKQQVINDFKISDNDTGSVEVQVALLTERIQSISEHMEKFPKDMSSKSGLLKAVARRRKFLEYLKEKDIQEYKNIVNRLGLRK